MKDEVARAGEADEIIINSSIVRKSKALVFIRNVLSQYPSDL